MKVLSLLWLMLTSMLLFSQTEEEQLALEYFNRGDFQRASEIYSTIFNKSGNLYVYDNYLISLIEIKDFKTAQTLVAKQQKKYPELARYRADELWIFKVAEEQKALEKSFNETMKWVGMNEQRALDVAKALNLRLQYDLELKVLCAADLRFVGSISILMQLAMSYQRNGDLSQMMDTYLRLLDIPMVEVKSIQDMMQDIINDDPLGKNKEILRERLLDKLQKESGDARYTDMLIWLYIQEGKFVAALTQAKAFDRRTKGDGSKVMEVGDIANSNKYWKEAISAYDYVIGKGTESMLYETAEEKKLWTQYERLTSNPEVPADSMRWLENQIRVFLQENSTNDGSYYEVKRVLAKINTYYLNRFDTSRKIIETLMYAPRISKLQLAQLKLDLADIGIISGDPYEAILLYGQIEKDFKNDTIGFHAKYKMGWTYYLLGEFDYSKALLEVLQGSTSKLIANDAMRLALFIQDNIDADSSYVPLQLFARAELEVHERKYRQALLTLDTILADNPAHPIRDDVVFLKAKIFLLLKEKQESISMLKDILSTYYYDILADDALMMLADIYRQSELDKEQAMKYYLQLITDFPESILAVEARKKYRQMRGDANQ